MVLTHEQRHNHHATHSGETETKQTEMRNSLNTLDSKKKHPNISKKRNMTVTMENLGCEIVKPK